MHVMLKQDPDCIKTHDPMIIWNDQEYMANRVDAYGLNPNIYEVHLGS